MIFHFWFVMTAFKENSLKVYNAVLLGHIVEYSKAVFLNSA